MTKTEAARLGGIASATKRTKDQRIEHATKGGIATIQKYGSAFYGHIATLNASSSKRGK